MAFAMVGIRYRDTMDSTRIVRPIHTDQRGEWKCAVYFDGRYAGTAPVPDSLFRADTRVGFVPAAP